MDAPTARPWVLFDLDGTLTDSAPGIMGGVRYALAQQGVAPPEASVLRRFIGPPLRDSFMRWCGLSEADAWEAVRQYRVYYQDRGMFENKVYDGIPQLLDALRNHALNLAIATAKPEPYARQIAEHFGLAPYFRHIVGARLDGTLVDKGAIIRHALAICDDADPARTLMVGDRENDATGAAQAGIDCLGVLWGYSDREELTAAGVTRLAATTDAAKSIILNRFRQ